MLSIKKTIRSYMPQIQATTAQMQLSPVLSEADELIQAIERDAEIHEDNWTLETTPDTESLEKDWSQIHLDIQRDPDWVRFSD